METTDDRVGFDWGGNSRSTLVLLWSCLVTVFACTWTVVHPNMPAPYEEFWFLAMRRIFWFFITLITPEITIFVALRQFLRCRKFTYTIKKTFSYWTMSHSYFAFMGGYVLQFKNNAGYRYHNPESISVVDEWNNFWYGSGEHYTVPEFAIWRLCLDDFERLYAKNQQLSFTFPELSKKEIKDRGKADSFAKLFTCAQVSWMLIQCIARAGEHLPISELEVTTLAYVALALVMYLLWWNKPFGAQVPVIIPYEGDPVPLLDREGLRRPFNQRIHMGFLSFERKSATQTEVIGAVIGGGLASMMFGAIHCTAWNFSFATRKEQEMWRLSSIIVIVVPILVSCWLLLCLSDSLADLPYVNEIAMILVPFVFIGFLAYLAARAILLFQVFYCLRSMPAGVYTTAAWVNYIPHFG